jgi:FkbM family methyltransferase
MQKKVYNFSYFFFRSFEKKIIKLLKIELLKKKSENVIVFDVGSYLGNFSRNIKNKIKESTFYLFDPNPNLIIKDFQYNCIGISNKEGLKNYYYNDFIPSSGSGFHKIIMNDFFWNLSRKLFTFNLFKKFTQFKVDTETIDNFCKKKKINRIDLLKVDTEGHEYEVLDGARNMLKNIKIIYLEIMSTKPSFDNKFIKIFKLLKKNNFNLIKKKYIKSTSLLSNIRSADCLFIKD